MSFLRLAPLVAIVLGMLILSACKDTESMLIGKWKNISLEEVVVFNKDKSGTFEVKDNPSLNFKWSMLNDDKVKIEVSFMGKAQTLLGKFEKDSFVLGGKGEQAIYKKIQ